MTMIKWLSYIISTTTTVYYLVLMSIPAITLHAKREPELMSSFQATSKGVFFCWKWAKLFGHQRNNPTQKCFFLYSNTPKRWTKGIGYLGIYNIPLQYQYPLFTHIWDIHLIDIHFMSHISLWRIVVDWKGGDFCFGSNFEGESPPPLLILQAMFFCQISSGYD